MKLIQISDFKLGRSIQGFYLCKEKHLRHTRTGDLFLDMIFSDSTGTIPGKLWDFVDQFQNRFQSGDPVAVKGKVTEFNDKLQIIVTKVNQATDKKYGKYGFSPDLLIKSIAEPVDDLWKRLSTLIATLPIPYKRLTKSIFSEHEQKIRVIPGSVCSHHPIRGGFLKHLVNTAEISMDILPYYPDLNKDLVLCGILLHDIGKVKSLNDDLQPGYTDAGRLIGNVALGIEILREATLSFKQFPEDILLQLEHIILSYKGGDDAGTLEAPRLPEAVFVYYIVALDCRMNLMLDVINNNPNPDWMDNHNNFHSELYNK
jgi:3'-5' exoribonuclease